jgi:hypothetical protein
VLTVRQKEFEEVESRLAPYWEKTKDVVLRPGTLGGLMGVGESGGFEIDVVPFSRSAF